MNHRALVLAALAALPLFPAVGPAAAQRPAPTAQIAEATAEAMATGATKTAGAAGPTLAQYVSVAQMMSALATRRHAGGAVKGLHLGERQRVALYRSRGGGKRKR